MLALDKPGNTVSSFWTTLSGSRSITYTQEHMVLATIPVMIGRKLMAMYTAAPNTTTSNASEALFRIFKGWILLCFTLHADALIKCYFLNKKKFHLRN